jgi:hypothetical protein
VGETKTGEGTGSWKILSNGKLYTLYLIRGWARGSLVVEELYYKPGGLGFETR